MSSAGRVPIPVAGDPGLRARLSPELIAVVMLVIGVGALVIPPFVPRFSIGAGPQSIPSPAAGLLTPQPESRFDTASIGLVIELNRLIGQSEAPLEAALAKRPLDSTEIRSELSRIVVNVRLGLDAAARLQSRAESRTVGKHVTSYYENLREIADGSFKAALANDLAHRRAAQRMIAALARRSAIDAELKALLALAKASPSPPPASQAPTPTVGTASASPPPSSGIPGSGIPGDLIVNGGFEVGVAPWQLALHDPAALARSSPDRAQLRVGRSSLRIEITSGSDSRAGIALEQHGLQIAGDSRYVVRLFARAEAGREIRVAVRNSAGTTYGGRVFAVTPTWTALELRFTALTSDPAGTLEVDLGRSTATVWLDAISVTPAGS
jgi:hypothetical protein